MMSVKYVVSLFAATLIGFAISPSYSTEIISCNGFESCPTSDGDAIVALTARVAALEALLADVSRLTDPNTSQDTLRFSGMNVQIVNGSGQTWATADGTGNLIIGYNEQRGIGDCAPEPFPCESRGGSHNLVGGSLNNYASYGGMVFGWANEISQEFATVSGGYGNVASGNYSSVSGGESNTASGIVSSISGGTGKSATATYCWEGDSAEDC